MERHSNKVVAFHVKNIDISISSGDQLLTLTGNSYKLCKEAHVPYIIKSDKVCDFCKTLCNNPVYSIRNMRYSDIHGIETGSIGFIYEKTIKISSKNFILCDSINKYGTPKIDFCQTCKSYCNNPVNYFSIERIPRYISFYDSIYTHIIINNSPTTLLILNINSPVLCDDEPKYPHEDTILCITCKSYCNNPTIHYDTGTLEEIAAKLTS